MLHGTIQLYGAVSCVYPTQSHLIHQGLVCVQSRAARAGDLIPCAQDLDSRRSKPRTSAAGQRKTPWPHSKPKVTAHWSGKMLSSASAPECTLRWSCAAVAWCTRGLTAVGWARASLPIASDGQTSPKRRGVGAGGHSVGPASCSLDHAPASPSLAGCRPRLPQTLEMASARCPL